jgi:hypothetical protein
MRSTFPIAVLSIALSACGAATGGGSSDSGAEVHSMKDAEVSTASLLVAKQIQRPLYIVLDDNLVKDSWDIEAMGKHAKLTNFQLFVERDLKKALEPYFVRVKVIRLKSELPTTPHVVADVKVDRVRINQQEAGLAVYLPLEMTWSFALRPSEADDYSFSYADTASSTPTFANLEGGMSQMAEAAITEMLHKWTESDGIEALRKLPASENTVPVEGKPKDGLKKL